ncbi:MAG: hypothetical protein HQL26_08255 [Candidatus Omnitrophica bacterium]|nr:hypothetical protein [Candidatus Omnitrophota bacterium]
MSNLLKQKNFLNYRHDIFLRLFFFVTLLLGYFVTYSFSVSSENYKWKETVLTARTYFGTNVRADFPNDPCVRGLVYLSNFKDSSARKLFSAMKDPGVCGPITDWVFAELDIRSGHLDKGHDKFLVLLKNYPKFYLADVTLAETLYFKKEYKRAFELADSLVKKGKEETSEDIFVDANLMAGANLAMVVHNGSLWTKITNGRKILPYLLTAEKLRPDSAEVLLGLGTFYLFSPSIVGGDLKKAEVYLKNAVAKKPLFPDAYARLGQYYQKKGDQVKFKENLDHALKLNPHSILANDIKTRKCDFICP